MIGDVEEPIPLYMCLGMPTVDGAGQNNSYVQVSGTSSAVSQSQDDEENIEEF